MAKPGNPLSILRATGLQGQAVRSGDTHLQQFLTTNRGKRHELEQGGSCTPVKFAKPKCRGNWIEKNLLSCARWKREKYHIHLYGWPKQHKDRQHTKNTPKKKQNQQHKKKQHPNTHKHKRTEPQKETTQEKTQTHTHTKGDRTTKKKHRPIICKVIKSHVR